MPTKVYPVFFWSLSGVEDNIFLLIRRVELCSSAAILHWAEAQRCYDAFAYNSVKKRPTTEKRWTGNLFDHDAGEYVVRKKQAITLQQCLDIRTICEVIIHLYCNFY